MPVEQRLPWHPVATRLASHTLPFLVVASHTHALPSSTFWFPVPAVLAASLASLPLSLSSAALSPVQPGVASVSCLAVLLLPLSVGAHGWHLCTPAPAPSAFPPHEDFASLYDVDCPARSGLVMAPLPPVWRASWGAGCSPRPCRVCGHLVEGGGGLVADGAFRFRRVWWLMRCSLRVVPSCVARRLAGARPPPSVGQSCSQLVGCVRASQPDALFPSVGTETRAEQHKASQSMGTARGAASSAHWNNTVHHTAQRSVAGQRSRETRAEHHRAAQGTHAWSQQRHNGIAQRSTAHYATQQSMPSHQSNNYEHPQHAQRAPTPSQYPTPKAGIKPTTPATHTRMTTTTNKQGTRAEHRHRPATPHPKASTAPTMHTTTRATPTHNTQGIFP